MDGEPIGWHDADEINRWRAALAGAAERILRERGVAEPWRLTVSYGSLWAEYGLRRVRVAGDGEELSGADDLFDDLDDWVAFHREAGPGVVLDGDEAVIAGWRERVPEVHRFWAEVAPRVMADVQATTGTDLQWRVTVHHDEIDWSALRLQGVHGVHIVHGVIGDSPPTLPRRPLAFPQIWLEVAGSGYALPDVMEVEEAVAHLAATIQDDVIEEVHGAWPPCPRPRHAHPLTIDITDSGTAVWCCPQLSDVSVAIGRLTDLGGWDG